MPDHNVVLMVRVDDMTQLTTVETRSTIVRVDAHAAAPPAEIAQMALDNAPPVKGWTRT